MMFRSRVRTISKAVLFVLFFAQAVTAYAACEMPDRAPARAVSHEAMPCHEEPAPNTNLCLVHCLSGDQSADTPQIAIPAWNCAAILTIEILDRSAIHSTALLHYLPRPAAPPPRILFHSFLI
jgi:hypothetical protein